MKTPEKLYEGNLRRKYFLFAVPVIISTLISQSYSFVNSMMIGKLLGSEAFAATAVTAELLQFLNSIFCGYLTGIGIYISVLFGKGEYKKMLDTIKVNFLISLSFAILISLICNLFCKEIFALLNVNSEVYRNAEIYFRTYVCGYIAFQFNWGFTYISHSMGLTKIPLTISTVTGIINVLLNYLFLSLWNKGIGYSAFASVLSNSLTTIVYFIVYIRQFSKMGLSIKGFGISRDLIKNSMGYGTPTMLQQMAMYACTAIVSPLTNSCATAAISGYAVANKARPLIMAVYQDSSKANTTFVGQAMGAGRIDRIKAGIKIGITQSLVFFGIAMTIFWVFARQFSCLFLDPATDAESITISVNIIRFLLPVTFFNVFNNLFHGIFRAVGSGTLMFISTMIYAVSYIIYAYTLFAVLPEEIRIYGVHMAIGLAYITEVIFAAVVFFTGKWKSPEYKRLEKEYNDSISNKAI
jgi:putative MATE family efflux protein